MDFKEKIKVIDEKFDEQYKNSKLPKRYIIYLKLFAYDTVASDNEVSLDFLDKLFKTNFKVVGNHKLKSNQTGTMARDSILVNGDFNDASSVHVRDIDTLENNYNIFNKIINPDLVGKYRYSLDKNLNLSVKINDDVTKEQREIIEDTLNDHLDKLSDENFALLMSYLDVDKLADTNVGKMVSVNYSFLSVIYHELNHAISKQEFSYSPSMEVALNNACIKENLKQNAGKPIYQFMGGICVQKDKYDSLEDKIITESNYDFGIYIHESITELLAFEKSKIRFPPITMKDVTYLPFVVCAYMFNQFNDNMLTKMYYNGVKEFNLTEKEFFNNTAIKTIQNLTGLKKVKVPEQFDNDMVINNISKSLIADFNNLQEYCFSEIKKAQIDKNNPELCGQILKNLLALRTKEAIIQSFPVNMPEEFIKNNDNINRIYKNLTYGFDEKFNELYERYQINNLEAVEKISEMQQNDIENGLKTETLNSNSCATKSDCNQVLDNTKVINEETAKTESLCDDKQRKKMDKTSFVKFKNKIESIFQDTKNLIK